MLYVCILHIKWMPAYRGQRADGRQWHTRYSPAIGLPQPCYWPAVALPGLCHGTATALPWPCHNSPTALPRHWHGHDATDGNDDVPNSNAGGEGDNGAAGDEGDASVSLLNS